MTTASVMRFAILQFPASNCDQDCVHALRVLGSPAKLVWHKDTSLGEVDAVIVPGGFGQRGVEEPSSMRASSTFGLGVRISVAIGSEKIKAMGNTHTKCLL